MRRLLFLLVVLCPLQGWSAERFQLDNGMQVIIQQDKRAPTVVSQLWYRAGSMDEQYGETGVAHVLEHMMFKGTHSIPPGRFSRIVAEAGGRDNAFTSKEATVYHQQLHKDQLELMLKLEADRMNNLLLTDEEFAKEIRVVMEERRLRTDDQPESLLYERVMATFFMQSGQHHPVIGWMHDLEQMTAEDARRWYRRWYTPNNATLVVVGDVEPARVLALAKQYFGALPTRPLPVRKPVAERPGQGKVVISHRGRVKQPHLLMVWQAPVLRDPDKDWQPYALDVLVGALSGSDAARLPKELVRGKKIAQSASASYDGVTRGTGALYLSAVAAEGRSVQELEQAVRNVLQEIAQKGIRDQELARIKAQVIASQTFERDSNYYRAMQLGTLANVNLPLSLVDEWADRIGKVSADQVKEVAQRYLQDETLVMGILQPEAAVREEGK